MMDRLRERGALRDGDDGDGGGVRAVRDPGADAHRAARLGGEGPHGDLEQRGGGRLGAGASPAVAADQEDGVELCRRERGVRAAVPEQRAGDRVQPAGDARRADPRGGRGHPGVLHSNRRGHRDRRRERDAGDRGEAVRHGDVAEVGPVSREGVAGRPGREPRVPQDGEELQPDDGAGGRGDGRGGRGGRRDGRDRARSGAHARGVRGSGRGDPEREADRAADGARARLTLEQGAGEHRDAVERLEGRAAR